jgi:signal transduction histidine kinase
VEARVNGALKRFTDGLEAPYGAYITLQFSPISFPENKVNLQYRLDENDPWSQIESRQLSLSNLKSGAHHVFVRAKKNTGLGWSDATVLNISVDAPYWKKVEFVFLVVFLVILIAWASYAISSAIMNQRKQYLQDQINQRTKELQQANEELTIRNTELDRFVYSASHDLSAPLKSILGLIIVAKLDEPGGTHAQYLNMMERSVHKLENFIEDVVTYSRNTRMPVRLERFNFKEFVEGLLQDHEYSQNFKHIKFLVEDHLPSPIMSDITRMKIILNNLLSNAIKFHWIDNCRDPYIRITAKKDGDHYELRVQDNGRGIREEHINRIFEMFYRATDEAQGSGLGLYILKESVLKLGGTVEAVSALEVGTTFIVRLPEAKQSPDA